MLRNPAILKIVRSNGNPGSLEIFPLYTLYGHQYVATDTFRLYEVYQGEDAADSATRFGRYLQHFDQSPVATAGYLGQLSFTGETLFEWLYQGTELNEEEVFQVVSVLQSRQANFIPGALLQPNLVFSYHNFHIRSHIRLIDNGGSFLVYINGRFSASIKPQAEDWEVSGGKLPDTGMQAAIIRRLRSYTTKL